jgi:hypothetical protein
LFQQIDLTGSSVNQQTDFDCSAKPPKSKPYLNGFLTNSDEHLINPTAKVRSDLVSFMSEFIIVGIIVILGVNGLYSRFCEQPKEKQ